MNRAYSPVLFAPLVLLAAADCRDETTAPTPTPDLAMQLPDLAEPGDLATTPVPDFAGADLAPPPAPTEFVVVRVGDGNAALTSAATAAFLERRKISDGSMVGTPIALPTAVAAANKRLTLGGSSIGEGSLTLSTDRKYLLLAGYDADVGTLAVATTTSAATNRVVGIIDGANVVDTSTAADFLSGSSIRGAASTDGKALWASGATGTFYLTQATAPVQLNAVNINMRWVNIFNGQLYVSSASATNRGVNMVGTGTPKTATTTTPLPGFAAQTASSGYGFVGFDRNAQPGLDVFYVADDSATASGGGVQRWSLAAGTWKLDGTLNNGLTGGARGLMGYISGKDVVLVATTAETTPRVVSFVDDGSALNTIAAKGLAKAGTNTAYRGIAPAPQ
ncbi:MAG TPA: hypothetical protein PLW65_23505 [Pseudomonadota bacterium]|nr:hypothetical protein [Pseudomonadota bacterium]